MEVEDSESRLKETADSDPENEQRVCPPKANGVLNSTECHENTEASTSGRDASTHGNISDSIAVVPTIRAETDIVNARDEDEDNNEENALVIDDKEEEKMEDGERVDNSNSAARKEEGQNLSSTDSSPKDADKGPTSGQTDERTPAGSVASTVNGTPTIASPAPRAVESPVTPSGSQTPVPGRQAKKQVRHSFPDSSFLDESDLEHLRKPFNHGWKREIVYRNTVDSSSKRQACDVYYFPPSGKKLRSMVEIATYLDAHKDSPVNLTHFTFKRQPLFKEPFEQVRTAGQSRRPAASKDKQSPAPLGKRVPKKKFVGSSDTLSKPMIKIVNPVSTAPLPSRSSSTVRTDTAVSKSINGTPRSSVTPLTSTPLPINTSSLLNRGGFTGRPRGRPKGSKTNYPPTLGVAASNVVRARIRPKIRPRSPEWVPTSSEDSDASSAGRDVEIIKEGVGPTQNSGDDDDDDLQNVLGTPSKLIASILRPEPPKRPLSDVTDVDEQAFKRIKIVSAQPQTSGTTGLLSAVTSMRSDDGTKFVVINSSPGSVSSSGKWTCSALCAGVRGAAPTLQCSECKAFYHRACVDLFPPSPYKNLCVNCTRQKKGTRVVVVPMSSVQHSSSVPGQSKILIPVSSLASMGAGSLANPILMSPAVLQSPPVSSNANRLSLSTSTPSLVARLSNPSLITCPSSSIPTIPPPPPLASCPRFELMTPGQPLNFRSILPAPPRLQPSNAIMVPQPPPLHLAGSLMTPSPQITGVPQVTSLSQPPLLRPCPQLITPKLAHLETPTVTTSSASKRIVLEPQGRARNLLPSMAPLPESESLTRPVGRESAVLSNSSTVNQPSPFEETTNVVNVDSDDMEEINSDKESEMHPVQENAPETDKSSLKRRRTSQSSFDSDDMDDYPPVSFEPQTSVNDSSSAVSETLTTGTLAALQTTPCEKQKKANMQEHLESLAALTSASQPAPTTNAASLVQNKQGAQPTAETLTPTPSMALPVPPTVYSALSKGRPKQSDISGTTANKPGALNTQNAQLLTLPLSVVSKLNLNAPMALKINGVEIIVPPTCVLSAADGIKILLPYGTFQAPTEPSSKLNVSISNDLSTVSINKPIFQTDSLTPLKSVEVPRPTRKQFLHSFRMLQASFDIMMEIFGYLPMPDLLSARRVCKTWLKMAMQPCLWKYVDLGGIRVKNWEDAAKFLNKAGVACLNLKGAILAPSSHWQDQMDKFVWDSVKKAIPTMKHLEQLFFDYVPATVLDSITEKMPQLVNVSAENIIDNDGLSVTPKSSTTKTEESMRDAVEAVTRGSLSTADAAKLFRVSERDLIHLTQNTEKLTEDEEKAVVLCCLRMSRMGFVVNVNTVMSKCQEMFARRFSTTSSVPISDVYCKDLYERNAPLFTPNTDVKSKDILRCRLDAHYSALRRLYNSFLPRKNLTASQVLAFDLSTFRLARTQYYNIMGNSVTALATLTACGRFLPLMLIWPKVTNATHPDVINAITKHGLPTPSVVFQYFQVILSIVKERPLVVICNGNSSLLSEKLISSCVSDSVYFYCVPSDIAKYVFPGHHGGVLHLLKKHISESVQSSEAFVDKLLALLRNKKHYVLLSTRLAISSTGVFPLNPKAPSQYQDVDLNAPPSHFRMSNKSAGHVLLQQAELVGNANSEAKIAEEISDDSDSNVLLVDEGENNERKKEKHVPVSNGDVENGTSAAENSKAGRKENWNETSDSNQGEQSLGLGKNDAAVVKREKPDSAKLCYARFLACKLLYRAKTNRKGKKPSVTKFLKHYGYINKQAKTSDLGNAETAIEKEQKKESEKHITSNSKTITRLKCDPDSLFQKQDAKFVQTYQESGLSEVSSSSHSKENVEDSWKVVCGHLDDVINDIIAESREDYDRRYPNGDINRANSQDKTNSRMVGHDKGVIQKRFQSEDSLNEAGTSGTPGASYVKSVGETSIVLKTVKSDSVAAATENMEIDSEEEEEEEEEEKDDNSVLENGNEQTNGGIDANGMSDESNEDVEEHSSHRSKRAKQSKKKRKKKNKQERNEHDSREEEEMEEETEGDETATISPVKERKKRKKSKKKKKKKEKRKKARQRESQTSLESSQYGSAKNETSSNDTANSVSLDESMGNVKVDKEETVETAEKDKEEHVGEAERKLINLQRLSLMDHDYFKMHNDTEKDEREEMGCTEENSCLTKSCGADVSSNESAHERNEFVVADQVLETHNPSSVEHAYSKDEPSVEESEDLVEESVVTTEEVEAEGDGDGDDSGSADSDSSSGSSHSSGSSKSSNSSAGSSKSSNNSASSSGKRSSKSDSSSNSSSDGSTSTSDEGSSSEEEESQLSSPKKMFRKQMDKSGRTNKNEEDSSSSNSSDSDDEGDDTDDESNSSSSDDSEKESADEEEEEEEEEGDDDSKCQMCMRSSPPHSKDMLIDWVDCDGNCGRWFHVICIQRSHSKGDTKHYVCPSCRCRR